MKLILLMLCIAGSYDFYYLVPNQAVTKMASDLGLLCLFGLLAYQIFIERHDFRKLNTFLTWYVLAYLSMVLIQASIASFYYEQSILDGLVVARNQFHLLFFVAVLLYFRTLADIDRFMLALSLTGVALFYLSLVNYFGPTIFNHRWAEGHGIRSGIVRAYVPGMTIFVLMCIWNLSQILKRPTLHYPSLIFLLTGMSALLFRQTKMHIMAALIGCALLLLAHRRFKILLYGVGALALVGTITSIKSGENLVVNLITSATVDVVDADASTRGPKSTWEHRLVQIDEAIDVLVDNFMTGSGGIVLRETESGNWNDDLNNIRRGMDLGYFVWVKYYGLPGVILMALLYFLWTLHWLRLRKSAAPSLQPLVETQGFHFVAMVVSMLTIGYLTIPGPMAMLSVSMATLAYCQYATKYSRSVGTIKARTAPQRISEGASAR